MGVFLFSGCSSRDSPGPAGWPRVQTFLWQDLGAAGHLYPLVAAQFSSPVLGLPGRSELPTASREILQVESASVAEATNPLCSQGGAGDWGRHGRERL